MFFNVTKSIVSTKRARFELTGRSEDARNPMPDNYCDFNDCSVNFHLSDLMNPHGIALLLGVLAVAYLWNTQDKKSHGWRIGRVVAWLVFLPSVVLITKLIVGLWLGLWRTIGTIGGLLLLWYWIEPALGKRFDWSQDRYLFRRRH